MNESADPSLLPPRARLRELDALRGIAALAVVIYHYTARFPEMFPAVPHVGFAFTWGHQSVLLFFAISGFVISFSLDRATSVSGFAIKRFARLYPAYWGAMAITLLVEHVAGFRELQVPLVAVVANLTMLQGFAYLPGVDGVYWTLGLELSFYVCMVVLWLTGASRRLELALMAWLAIACLAWAWPEMPSRLTMLLVLQYIPFFGIGMLAYRVWSGHRSWKQQLPYFVAMLVGVLVQMQSDAAIFALMLVGLFAALVHGKLRFLAVRPLLWLGGISYALYLVHHNIGFVILLQSSAMRLPPAIAFWLALSVAVALAVLLRHFIEQPAERAIMRWWKNRGRRADQPLHDGASVA